MSDNLTGRQCKWCVRPALRYDWQCNCVIFECGTQQKTSGEWAQSAACEEIFYNSRQPPPIPPAPPRPPQPASDRQELIRRFAVAIVGGYYACPDSAMNWPSVWKYATELADAEPRVDGTEGTA